MTIPHHRLEKGEELEPPLFHFFITSKFSGYIPRGLCPNRV